MASPSVRDSLLLAAVLVLAPPLAAQTPPPAEAPAAAPVASKPAEKPWYEKFAVSGLLFGDVYAVAAHHDPEIDGQYGFWLRRGYLTFDTDLAARWSARFRLEVNSPGDFESSSKMTPFVKDAYVAWKDEDHELYLGISPSPTFEFVDGFWGYRDTEFDLFLVGLDYRIHGMISVIPNAEYVAYRESGGVPAPDDDLIARLTLHVRF